MSWEVPQAWAKRDSWPTYVQVLSVYFFKIFCFFIHTIPSLTSLSISNILILQSLIFMSIISDSWGTNYPFAAPAGSLSRWLIFFSEFFVP